MSQEIWLIFLVHLWFQLLRCSTQSFRENWQQKILTSTESYKGRIKIQPVLSSEVSAGPSSRKLWRREKIVPLQIPTLSKDTDEQLKLPHGVDDIVDCAKEKKMRDYVVLHCGQAREFICSSPVFFKKVGAEKFQQITSVNYKLDELTYVFDVMKSVYDKVFATQFICNLL